MLITTIYDDLVSLRQVSEFQNRTGKDIDANY
jgi:hypothetical protein